MKSVVQRVVLSLVTLLAIGLSATGQAEIRNRNIKVGIGLNADHPQALAVNKFGDLVAARSRGKMKVKLYASGQLGNDLTMISALQGGTLEMTVPDTSTLVGQIKEFGVLNFPFLFNNEAEADALLDGPFGQKLLAKLPEKGLVGLSFWENGFRQATNSRRPLNSVEDFSGLKLRVMQNPLFIDTFKAVGANAVPMAFTELFSALETKTVDGQENPLPTIESSKFYEVQKYLTLSRHTYSVWAHLVSKKFWDSLTPEEQGIIRQAAVEARDYERKIIRAAGDQSLAELKKAGMQVNELPPAEVDKLRQRAQPVIERFSKEFGEQTANEMYAELRKIRAGGAKPAKKM